MQPHPGPNGGLVPRAEELLNESGRHNERGCQHEDQLCRACEPGAAHTHRLLAGSGSCQRRPAAAGPEHPRHRNREARDLHDDLDHVDPRGCSKPAHHEVQRRHAPAKHRAPGLGNPSDNTQHQSHGNNLAGENRRCAAEQDRGRDEARGAPVARLQIVADRVEVQTLRDAVHARPDRESKRDRADACRADPPPSGQALAIAELGCPHRAARAQIRREEGGEQQRGRQIPACDEEVLGSAHRARGKCPD